MMKMDKFTYEKQLRGRKIPLGARAVLGVILSYADRDGTNAYPGDTRLAADVVCSVRTIERHRKWLQENGYLTTISPARSLGNAKAAVYAVALPEVPDNSESTRQNCREVPDKNGESTRQNCREVPDKNVGPPDQLPSQDHTTDHGQRVADVNEENLDARTKKFLTVYPKPGRYEWVRDALAEQLSSGVPFESIIAAAEVYAEQVKQDGTDVRFVKFPSNWLRERKFEDMPKSPAQQFEEWITDADAAGVTQRYGFICSDPDHIPEAVTSDREAWAHFDREHRRKWITGIRDFVLHGAPLPE